MLLLSLSLTVDSKCICREIRKFLPFLALVVDFSLLQLSLALLLLHSQALYPGQAGLYSFNR